MIPRLLEKNHAQQWSAMAIRRKVISLQSMWPVVSLRGRATDFAAAVSKYRHVFGQNGVTFVNDTPRCWW
jgi:hypothetical protein